MLIHLLLFLAVFGLVETASADCTSPAGKAGARKTISGTPNLCDGTRWTPMFTDGSTGACSVAGRWEWNSASTSYTHCNGSNFIRARAPACTPTSLTYRSRRTSAALNVATALQINPAGTRAYVSSQFGNQIVTMDISASPAQPTIVGTSVAITQLGDTVDMKLHGNYLYTANRSSRSLVVTSVATDTPTYSGHYNNTTNFTNAWSLDSSADGSYVYVVSWASGATNNRCILTTVNVTNPASPSHQHTLDITPLTSPTIQYCNRIRRYGNKAVITFAEGALVTVSLADPAVPAYVSMLTHGSANGLEYLALSADGNTAVTTTNSSARFYTFNVTNPSAPAYLTNFQDTGRFSTSNGIDVRGRYAIVAGKTNDTVALVDINNPSSPSVVTAASLTDSTNIDGVSAVRAYGRFVYATVSSDNSLVVLDMGCDPISTTNFGSCSVAGRMEYFPDARAFGYCDGSAYRVMGQAQNY